MSPWLLALVLLVAVGAVEATQLYDSLQYSYDLAVATDTYGNFRASSVQLLPSPNFREALRGNGQLLGNVSAAFRVEIDLDDVDGVDGSLHLFTDSLDTALLTFRFHFQSSRGKESSVSSGTYQTATICYGTYHWRWVSANEFVLQFVDHIFNNSTTIHGYAEPSEVNKKPWYHTWSLVLVTAGVFLIRMWLSAMEARRTRKKLAMAAAQKKKA